MYYKSIQTKEEEEKKLREKKKQWNSNKQQYKFKKIPEIPEHNE